ncbi:GxxExxY protein [Marispirochaeta sp.]|uniref:GxxExxY protein n=1 Tax=Marispirochaeta sp. TaxID=2038653 RepID=UPI0029C793CA|nr:GxxExxY protein [Marispirochaeta sp.]
MSAFIHKDLSHTVLGAAFRVHSSLGEGLLEKVYQRAYVLELQAQGLSIVQQAAFPVFYRGESVGTFRADMVVNNTILIELKAVSHVTAGMESQLYNYLKLSSLQVGYLFNFNAPSLYYKRLVNTRGGLA